MPNKIITFEESRRDEDLRDADAGVFFGLGRFLRLFG